MNPGGAILSRGRDFLVNVIADYIFFAKFAI